MVFGNPGETSKYGGVLLESPGMAYKYHRLWCLMLMAYKWIHKIDQYDYLFARIPIINKKHSKSNTLAFLPRPKGDSLANFLPAVI
ncbi:hypothetical protein H5410_034170 [Solanum commersonii]|uniref:Uncharacterized protein n=1 Tax=Solanum commersonii TaxID=4109 RepID=A0A9J5YST2_SOLCO|nr:hypothetical protein H5410_034170 [Solanum commersonii]